MVRGSWKGGAWVASERRAVRGRMDGARRFTKVNPPHLPLEDSEYIGRTRGESLGIHLELVGGTIHAPPVSTVHTSGSQLSLRPRAL